MSATKLFSEIDIRSSSLSRDKATREAIVSARCGLKELRATSYSKRASGAESIDWVFPLAGNTCEANTVAAA